MPTGKIEILMKHIRQIEAVEALCECIRVCRCGSACVFKRQSRPFIQEKSDYLEGTLLFTETYCMV